MARLEPKMQANSNDFQVEIPKYEGKLDPEEFLDWLHTVERVLKYKDIPEEKKVKLVALRLHKYASLWWTNLCAKRIRKRSPKSEQGGRLNLSLRLSFFLVLMFKIITLNSTT